MFTYAAVLIIAAAIAWWMLQLQRRSQSATIAFTVPSGTTYNGRIVERMSDPDGTRWVKVEYQTLGGWTMATRVIEVNN